MTQAVVEGPIAIQLLNLEIYGVIGKRLASRFPIHPINFKAEKRARMARWHRRQEPLATAAVLGAEAQL